MTRKDYILIAEVFRIEYLNANGQWERTALDNTAQSLCDALHSDNPRFDKEHFFAVVRGEKPLESRPARR